MEKNYCLGISIPVSRTTYILQELREHLSKWARLMENFLKNKSRLILKGSITIIWEHL
jgi:hypothetical protein